MPKKSKRFLPESIENAMWSIASVSFGIGLFVLALVLILSLVFHNPWLAGVAAESTIARQSIIGNIIGAFIFTIGFIPTLFVFLYMGRIGINILIKQPDPAPEYNIMRALIATVMGAAGLGAIAINASFGGIAGVIVASDLVRFFGDVTFVFGVVFLVGFLIMAAMLLRIKLIHIKYIYRQVRHIVKTLLSALHLIEYTRTADEDAEEYEETEEYEYEEEEEEYEEDEEIEEAKPRKRAPRKMGSLFRLPDPKFLEKSIFAKYTVTPELKRNAINMEASFSQYGIMGDVRGIKPGPVVTLYEFEPVLGMRYKSIEQTVPDMTRSMETVNIRMAPIPGTKFVGVEMVNMSREEIRMQNLILDKSFKESKHAIPVILGVNIGGNPIVIDLAKQPHMLIAGRTGSGKSVFMQSILMSLFYRFRPDELKIIMVDPKTVEFALWENIPHLMAPVVSDAQKSVNVMKWAVREMEERYKKFKDNAVQNITGYNQVMEEMRAKNKKIIKNVPVGTDEEGNLEYEIHEEEPTNMPYVVVIFDEVAELMAVARKDIEAAVQRLAQAARAAGIHLVLATQRPSADIITGVIKANFPTRISFQARSAIDSRTTLGDSGAEQLLACGDMLYSESGKAPVRIHGPNIENHEIKKVANFLREMGAPEYIDGLDGEEGGQMDASGFLPASGKGAKMDEMYAEAVEIVRRDKKPTISYLQRRLGIGYNKAATLVEQMEANGVISSPGPGGKREVL